MSFAKEIKCVVIGEVIMKKRQRKKNFKKRFLIMSKVRDEGNQFFTKDTLEAMENINRIANKGYQYGQYKVTQSLTEEEREIIQSHLKRT